MFWESAQKSNSIADYKAYLDAFPNGVYAPLARNRIATMNPPPPAAPPAPPAAREPGPSPVALKAEIGTMETEQTLNLAPGDRIELQQRLQALGLYSGPIDGNLGPTLRAAIGTWQKQHELATTGWLGPLQLAALKAESDAAAQPPPGAPGAPPAQPGPAAASNPEKAAQETAFWESAQRSNLAADYQAYLQAFPNGLYAQMARNRIASLTSGPPAGPGPEPGPGAPSALGPPPQPVSPEALKAEIGTVETEQTLDIGPPGRMELQQRLTALGLYNGPVDGDLGPMARAAIAEWQKRHDLAPTGELGPLPAGGTADRKRRGVPAVRRRPPRRRAAGLRSGPPLLPPQRSRPRARQQQRRSGGPRRHSRRRRARNSRGEARRQVRGRQRRRQGRRQGRKGKEEIILAGRELFRPPARRAGRRLFQTDRSAAGRRRVGRSGRGYGSPWRSDCAAARRNPGHRNFREGSRGQANLKCSAMMLRFGIRSARSDFSTLVTIAGDPLTRQSRSARSAKSRQRDRVSIVSSPMFSDESDGESDRARREERFGSRNAFSRAAPSAFGPLVDRAFASRRRSGQKASKGLLAARSPIRSPGDRQGTLRSNSEWHWEQKFSDAT